MKRTEIMVLAGVLVVVIGATPATLSYTNLNPAPKVIEPVVVVAEVTAYSELDSCHYPGCPMKSGKRAYVGAVACPREIPLGTEAVIDGETYICEDWTAKRYNGRFDIFFGYGQEAHDEAWDFGIQEKEVALKL